MVTATASSFKGEYIFVDTIASRSYTATVGKTVTVSGSGSVTYA
jgi:hypothetical protein